MDLDVYLSDTDVLATSEFDRKEDDFGISGYVPVLEEENSSSLVAMCAGLLMVVLML